jgi:beta-N-acetylhexosaminidase
MITAQKDIMRILKYFFLITLLCCSNGIAATPSLKEKIGQMLIIGFEGKHIDESSPVTKAIAEHNIGGVILFDYNSQTKQFDKNIESPLQVRELNQRLQQYTALSNI